MTFKYKLITIAIIGFTFGGWFTLDTGGKYVVNSLILCGGLLIATLCFGFALMPTPKEPYERFKNCRKIEL